MRGKWLFPAVAASLMATGVARAEPLKLPTGPTGYVVIPSSPVREADTVGISKIIYLNRCAGGCTITKSNDDAREQTSSILQKGAVTLSEFQWSDTTWNEMMACVKELYAPYDVEVTDTDPGMVFHHEAIVAGTTAEMALPTGTLGVAPLYQDGHAANNVISFTLANSIGDNVEELCWTAAQESAHAFGLDHEYQCSDPMTYLPGCSRKYFRDDYFHCGRTSEEQCIYGGPVQNAHQKLLNVFGPGPGAAAPSVTVKLPMDGATITRRNGIYPSATDPRGIRKIDLIINGYKWDSSEITVSSDDPQTSYPKTYEPSFALPKTLPEGYLDLELKAYNDIGVSASAKVTVLFGSPCTSADSCLDGQQCNDGRCAWPPPTGEVGDTCDRKQDCLSDFCQSNGNESRCTVTCTPGVTDPCANGFDCLETATAGVGICWPPGDPAAGCCSTGNRQRAPWLELGLFLGMIGFIVRRR